MDIKLFHSLSRLMARSLPERRRHAWLARHSDRCPVCRAVWDRQARLDTLLHRAMREEAAHQGMAGSDPFMERLWARLDREALPTPHVTRLVPVRLALAIVALTALGLAVARWTGAPVAPRSDSAIAQGPDQPRQPSQPILRSPGPQALRRSPQLGAADANSVRTTSRRDIPILAPRFSVGTEAPGSPSPGGTAERRPAVGRPAIGDLDYLNAGSGQDTRAWVRLTADEWDRIEARVRRRVQVRDDFVTVPFPRIAAASDRAVVAATEAYKREATIVDTRLSHEVTCAFKATALADLGNQLMAETGIPLSAGPSVTDEKVTLFCQKTPLREVMRQLSRPFGYTWLRSGSAGQYRYELVQDLRSQLLEEELRNRDRHSSLLALAKEMERYRPYLALSPEEALARSKSASPGDKKLLEQFATDGWGAIQMYFRLTPQQLAALRAGQKLTFSADPQPGELPLPRDLERGILQSQPYRRLIRREDDGFDLRYAPENDSPNSLPLTAIPEVHALVVLEMPEQELGQYAFAGSPGFFAPGTRTEGFPGPWAVGRSPSSVEPNNTAVNARLARDPALQRRISVQPVAHNPEASVGDNVAQLPGAASPRKITSADVLEALHQASGLPIVADYYTRLYDPKAVSLPDRPLFEVLNRLADRMRLRWNREATTAGAGGWLQFRSTSFYYDRLKEVPNRPLTRWVASRREHGYLTLDDLIDIAQLSDTQLDAADMAEGARDYWGLKEWDLVRSQPGALVRPHLRALVAFTPAQRQEMLGPAGLPFARMSLAQQQKFIAFALEFDGTPLQSLDELAGSTLRVKYTQPGWFEWRPPGPWWLRYVVPVERGKRMPLPPVRERTREAALQSLRRMDPQIREAILQACHRADPRTDTASLDEAAQIVPTERELAIIYIPDSTNKRNIRVVWGIGGNSVMSTW